MKTVTVIGEIPKNIPKHSTLNIHRNRNGVHSIGNYPARFIPEIPRWAIHNYTSENQTVLDPFCGSGTTLIESLIAKRNAIGIDHNPVAVLFARIKTKPFSDISIQDSVMELKSNLANTTTKYELPEFKNRDFWFEKDVVIALGKLKAAINLTTNSTSKDFFLGVFLDLVNVVSKVGSGQILQARRSNYNNKKSYSQQDVQNLFFEKLSNYYKLLRTVFRNFSKNHEPKVINSDAKSLKLIDKIDAIITSPPYINAIDYIWASKLKLHWSGFIQNDNERLNLSSMEIGTERIKDIEIDSTGILELDKKIEDIQMGVKYKASKGQNELRAKVTYKYFRDMNQHFSKAAELLERESLYCLVMGDNNICKVEIPTAKYLSELAEINGFRKEFQFNVLLKNKSLNIPRNVEWASDIKYDRIIILRKN